MAPRSKATTDCIELEIEPDGVRYLEVHGEELARRIFVAVRDPAWGTVPGSVIDSMVTNEAGELDISMTLEHVDASQGIDFEWRGTLRADNDGSFEFELDGIARSSFRYARIGLCVLHPVAFASARYRARTPDGWIEGHLPDVIAPQLPGSHGFGEPLFPAFVELELTRNDGIGVSLAFEGDLFELEDQRNWTDASFKTYSTPLALGDQHFAELGETFHQRVRLTPIATSAQSRVTKITKSSRAARPVITLGQISDIPVPPIGLASASHGRRLTPREIELLADLSPAHIRIELHLTDAAMETVLCQAANEAETIGAGLEVAIATSGQTAEIERFTAVLAQLPVRVDRVILLDQQGDLAPQETVLKTRRAFAGVGDSLELYSGTGGLFADLNAARPTAVDYYDGIAYALTPTIHADDDLSLIETIPIHGETVRTARTFVGDLPIAVGPVTFRERPRHVVAAAHQGGRPTTPVDPRQYSLLGAVWTLGTAASLAAQSAVSLTYFETSGDHGVISEDGLAAFPLYHPLADICELRGARQISVSTPESFAALAAKARTGSTHLLLANLNTTPAAITIKGIPDGQTGIRRLNHDSPPAAFDDPTAFRRHSETVATVNSLELEPFELLRVDVNP